MKLVYTLYPDKFAFMHEHIDGYVLQLGNVPLNPFFLLSTKFDDGLIQQVRETLMKRADEIWIFEEMSGRARRDATREVAQKPARYFRIKDSKEIIESRELVPGKRRLIYREFW